jgi:hypothetical protein
MEIISAKPVAPPHFWARVGATVSRKVVSEEEEKEVIGQK